MAGTGSSPSNISSNGSGHKRARPECEGGSSLGSSIHSSALSSSLLSMSVSMMGGGAEEAGDDDLLESLLNLPTTSAEAVAATPAKGHATKRARLDTAERACL